MDIREYFDNNDCRKLTKMLKNCAYVHPLWQNLVIKHKNLLLFEVCSTVTEGRFNRQFECVNDISPLNDLLKSIIFYMDNCEMDVSNKNELKFSIYLYDYELFNFEYLK